MSSNSDTVDNAVIRKLAWYPARSQWLIAGALMASLAAMTVGLVPRSTASLEVLSDLDCVIEPSRLVELGSPVPGVLASSYYDRSDFVSAGTLMAQLESEVEKAALAIAEEAAVSSTALKLRQVTADFGIRTQNRNSKLHKTADISAQVMDQVSTEAAVARLQVQQEQESRLLAELEVRRAKATLARRQLRSPISGSVTRRYKSAGEYVDSEPVFQIAQLDPLHVEVIIPVEHLGNIETGMNAGISLAAPGFENELLNAVVRRIDPVADAASATYGVQLVLENPDLTVPAGVRCEVDFYAS